LTADQQQSLRLADERGMALVTMIDGRVAIILPPCASDDATAEYIVRVTDALERMHSEDNAEPDSERTRDDAHLLDLERERDKPR
jgi:hypothetical protein